MSNETHTIRDVELFSTGRHNGDSYTEHDLDEMVDAFGKIGFAPALKAGHDDRPGQPAIGWIENLRRVGSKLIGDITSIPAEIYSLIKRRGYDRVSAEIYWNLKNARGNFRRALKAVALLGADVPAVATLKPLHQHFSLGGHAAAVRTYELDGDIFMTSQSYEHKAMTPEDAGMRLNEIAQTYCRTDALDYSTALRRALDENPDLKEMWHAELSTHERYRQETPIHKYAADEMNPADVLDRRAKRLMSYDDSLTYSQACQKALRRDSLLAQAYSEFQATDVEIEDEDY